MPATVAPWIDPADLADDDRVTDIELPSPLELGDCVQAATDLLYRWSGRKYLVVTDTVRPVRMSPQCGCSAYACGCITTVLELVRPVSAISEVRVDGIVLSDTAYQLVDRGMLVRVDGGHFPCCQSLSTPLTERGTWSVTYTHGNAPPRAGQLACHELAVHTALTLANKESKLPQRTARVDRKGISIEMDRPRGAQARGSMQVRGADWSTGITLVDQFIIAENPAALGRSASVRSPDSVALRRV